MITENQVKTCQNCKNKFIIEPEDFDFYKKTKDPPPTFCPECRMQQRLAHRNERTLYRRTCDLCNKSTVSLYPQNVSFPVYCSSCWFSDDWGAKDYALGYKPEKPFFEQFAELQKRVPRIALLVITSVNSEYTNNTGDIKNCYLIFAAEQCEDCMYGRLIQCCNSVVDVAFVYDSELCYECVDCRNCYNVLFSERCQTSTDLLFCFDCRNSQNCILTVNGRHKKYCIENKEVSKEEFEKRKKEILSSYDNIQKAKQRFEELKSQALVKYAFITKCHNATGDYLHNCHEVRSVYDSTNAKACKYLADAEDPIDCYDGNNVYYKPELCLDLMGILQCYKSKHSRYVFYCNEVEYCDSLHNCEYCFGCIGLKKSRYCILNKEYSKEEYEKFKQQIIQSLIQEELYGQFIPAQLSPFGYNETLAKDYYPLSKEEAIQQGFRWQDQETGTFGKETITRARMPQTIDEVEDAITDEIFVCETCDRNFKITPQELAFYKRMHLPLPRNDFECRHQARVRQRTPRRLHHRQCQCAGMLSDGKKYQNTVTHFHGKNHCPNEFETGYASDRPEIVYCEKCYQSEVV
ncbi:hypothetical protein MYX07_01510 [Patescibacteria group bacterium AH-259-L07]|nr:hypothetical protein [Patescibacteria group bacterium AH-259-L07]